MRRIAVTFDYRCPFARNAHEAIVTAIEEGLTPDVEFRFVPFSLDQSHVEEGAPDVWDRPADQRGSGVLALEWGIATREQFPAQFPAMHRALFAQRHDRSRRLDLDAVRDAAAEAGLDPGAIEAEVASGRPLALLASEHREAVRTLDVFGVPTFIEDGVATFIRFMERNRTDDLLRSLDLLAWTNLNEFKRTQIPS